MRIALIVLEAFNEIDSLLASTLLRRVKAADWKVALVAPEAEVTSMNGIRIQAEQPLEWARGADVVVFGSGRRSREQSQDRELLKRLKGLELQPGRQLIGSQCSGALMLQALGLGDGMLCTDQRTRPVLEAIGVEVPDKAFYATPYLASAGGCLAAQYLAGWVIRRCLGEQALDEALDSIAPVAQEAEYRAAARATIGPYCPSEPFVPPAVLHSSKPD